MIKKVIGLCCMSLMLSCSAQGKIFQSDLGITGIMPNSWVHVDKKFLKDICNNENIPAGKNIPEATIKTIKTLVEKNGI